MLTGGGYETKYLHFFEEISLESFCLGVISLSSLISPPMVPRSGIKSRFAGEDEWAVNLWFPDIWLP